MDSAKDQGDQVRLQKSKRELPCCKTPIRVKIIEPGLQWRKCELCKTVNYFLLEEMSVMPGILKLRWVNSGEAERYLESVATDDQLAHDHEI